MSYLAITPIPALQDNYIWAIAHTIARQVILVDPGESLPAVQFLQHHAYHLAGILLTHHHNDHTQGVPELLELFPDIPIYGSIESRLCFINHPIVDPSIIVVHPLFPPYTVLNIPGHTRDHIAYWDTENAQLFCGDTLFAGGCGRAFEGTLAQLYDSLNQIAALPDHTQIYCAHEYTEKNLAFAHHVEPNNPAIITRQKQIYHLRQKGHPSLPSSLQEEKATNPFLRCHSPDIISSAERYMGKQLTSPLEVFTALRQWKNSF